jgi:aspartyl-tRNA(Asn)/glutamyl-tRNA(Gln) amidotransferase subunit A
MGGPPAARAPGGARSGVRGLRIGFVRHFHEADMPAAPEVKQSLEDAARVLTELGAVVSEIALPSLNDFSAVNRVILHAEAWSIHAEWLRARPGAYGQLSRRRLMTGAFLGAGDHVDAMRRRRQLVAAVEAAFAGVDLLLTANSMEPPCRIDSEDDIARTYPRQARTPFNVTGHPALCLMSGLSPDGLPLSLQLVGKFWDEPTVFAAAEAYEQATDWHRRHPAVD